jgi:hypothetical protein
MMMALMMMVMMMVIVKSISIDIALTSARDRPMLFTVNGVHYCQSTSSHSFIRSAAE